MTTCYQVNLTCKATFRSWLSQLVTLPDLPKLNKKYFIICKVVILKGAMCWIFYSRRGCCYFWTAYSGSSGSYSAPFVPYPTFLHFYWTRKPEQVMFMSSKKSSNNKPACWFAATQSVLLLGQDLCIARCQWLGWWVMHKEALVSLKIWLVLHQKIQLLLYAFIHQQLVLQRDLRNIQNYWSLSSATSSSHLGQKNY